MHDSMAILHDMMDYDNTKLYYDLREPDQENRKNTLRIRKVIGDEATQVRDRKRQASDLLFSLFSSGFASRAAAASVIHCEHHF